MNTLFLKGLGIIAITSLLCYLFTGKFKPITVAIILVIVSAIYHFITSM